MSVPAITAVSAVSPALPQPAAAPAAQVTGQGFADLLTNGLAATEAKLATADKLVAQFAVDDSIPVHRVTYALEEARLSFELMLQVRNRLLEGTQQLLNMQL